MLSNYFYTLFLYALYLTCYIICYIKKTIYLYVALSLIGHMLYYLCYIIRCMILLLCCYMLCAFQWDGCHWLNKLRFVMSKP